MPRLSITGTPVLCGPGAGPNVRWFDAADTVRQDCDTGVCHLVKREMSTGKDTVVDPLGANWLAAGFTIWAARLHGNGYRDSLGRTNSDWMPLEVDAYSGVVLVSNYTNGRGLWLVELSGMVDQIADVVLDVQQGDIHKGIVIYRAGGQLRRWPDDAVFPVTGSDARYADGYMCLNYNGLWFVPWSRPDHGLLLSGDGHDFNPDICTLSSGLVRVVSSRTAGEGPGDRHSSACAADSARSSGAA